MWEHIKGWACYSSVNKNFLFYDNAIEIILENIMIKNHMLISRY